jgi:hypothetical protein
MATKSGSKKGGKKGARRRSSKKRSGYVVQDSDPTPDRSKGSPIIITGGSITVDFPEADGYSVDSEPPPGTIVLNNPDAAIVSLSVFNGRTYVPSGTNTPVISFLIPPEWTDQCVIEIGTEIPFV